MFLNINKALKIDFELRLFAKMKQVDFCTEESCMAYIKEVGTKGPLQYMWSLKFVTASIRTKLVGQLFKGDSHKKYASRSLPSNKNKMIPLLVTLGTKPVLSDLLIYNDFSEYFDDSSLRDALQELQRMSLLTLNPEKDSYSMHPVVHQWIRERA
jgi:hypothetical protein